MVPEIVVGFLAVIKIGGIAVPIFSGFGAHALASRLDIAGAKILLTADGSLRRGKTVEIKKEADKAAASVASIEHVIVFNHVNTKVSWDDKCDLWWNEIVQNQSDECDSEQMDSEENAMIIFSSG